MTELADYRQKSPGKVEIYAALALALASVGTGQFLLTGAVIGAFPLATGALSGLGFMKLASVLKDAYLGELLYGPLDRVGEVPKSQELKTAKEGLVAARSSLEASVDDISQTLSSPAPGSSPRP